MRRRTVLVLSVIGVVILLWVNQHIRETIRQARQMEKQILAGAHPAKPSAIPKGSSVTPAARATAVSGSFAGLLIDNGWPRDAAEAFTARNAELTDSVAAEKCAWMLGRLGALSKMADREVFSQMSQTPELAWLLAGSQDPNEVFKAWKESRDKVRITFLNVMLLQTDPSRVMELARGWKRHGSAITDAWGRGLIGAEAVLIRARGDESDRAFDEWTGKLFVDAKWNDAQDVAARIMLVIDEGAELRRRLRDETFRIAFASNWDKLLRVKAKANCPLGQLIRHPDIWNLLKREDGVELASAYGTVPADLLFGKDAYRLEVQGRVVRLLQSKMLVAFETLRREDLRKDDRFVGTFIDLLGRDSLSDEVLLKILDDIQRLGPGAVFEKISGKSNQDLITLYKDKINLVSWDDNLPGYLKVPRRWLAGVPLDDQDLNKAFLDAVFDGTNAVVFVAGAAFEVPTEPAGKVIGAIKEGANKALDAKAKQEIADQKARFERVIVPVLNDDSKRIMENSLKQRMQGDKWFEHTERALLKLTRLQIQGGDENATAAFETLYASDPRFAAIPADLKRRGLMLRFSTDRRMYLSPVTDKTTAYSTLNQEAWGKQASRVWSENLCKDAR